MRPYFIILLLLFAALAHETAAKRSTSRRGKSSSSSSSGWSLFGRKDNKAPAPAPKKPDPIAKPAPAKPSAPKPEPEIKKETTNLQQSANNPQARPIGWDTNQNAPQQHQQAANHAQPPAYSPQQPPGYPQQPPGYPQQPPGYHQQPPGYPQQPPGYHQQPPAYSPGAYPPAYSQHPSGYPQQPPAYSPGYPGYHQGGYQQGGYQQGGYQQGYPMGGYMGQQSKPGFFGSMFGGGNKHSSMGYGPYGYGGSGYGMKKSGGFLGKNVFRNALIGLFAWQLISGLTRRPYNVYNHYNVPKEEREEIKLPPNTLTLCSENATSLCVPGVTAICTLDGSVLCVVTMEKAAACKDANGELCVTSKVECLGPEDPLCQNGTAVNGVATVSQPCFTNMTLGEGVANVTLPKSEGNRFCVTTMAVPDHTNETVAAESTTTAGFNQTSTSGAGPGLVVPESSSTNPSLGNGDGIPVVSGATGPPVMDSSSTTSTSTLGDGDGVLAVPGVVEDAPVLPEANSTFKSIPVE